MLHRIAKRLNQAREDERGFTLIELLVVVIIIGILMGIAVPIFLNQREGAEDAAARANVRGAASAEQAYRTDPANAAYTTVAAALQPFGFNQGTPVVRFDSATATTFCVEAGPNGTDEWNMTEDSGNPAAGSC